MPNTFANLNVPTSDTAPGTPFDVHATGRQKTFVLDGAVRSGGRYIVEGSADGGVTWDILVGGDGTQVLFATDNAGLKTVDAIITHVRVRSESNGIVPSPPSITVGAPPAVGTNVFRGLPVSSTNGPGPVVDLTDSAGPAKTVVLRQGAGPIPKGARYSILASMDGSKFDEVALFTADRQGTRPVEIMCRFMQVLREALGDAPVIAVGAEGLPTSGIGCSIESLSLAEEKTAGVETIIGEWSVDFDTLTELGATIGTVLSAVGRVQAAEQAYHLRLYVGGSINTIDGTLVGQVLESPGDVTEHAVSIRENLSRPVGRVPVKVTLASDVADVDAAHVRGLLCQFTCPLMSPGGTGVVA